MQTPTEVLNIGADVAKDEIVVACSQGSFPVRKLANQRSALLAFLKDLPAGSRIGMESTGAYHELLADAAHKLGFVVFVLNPKDARHYAKAVGLRGKTDRVDAELIARMVAHEHTKLHPWIPPTAEQREMARLIKHRGKRRLSKRGPAELRRLLYVAAMSAKKKQAWKPLFEHYRAKGLSSTAALVIMARRIARTAWSLYTYKTDFDPARLTKSLT